MTRNFGRARRITAVCGAVVGVSAAVVSYWYWKNARGQSSGPEKSRFHRDSVVVVDQVDDGNNYANLLRENPGIVIVATSGIDLRSVVDQNDAWRVIQTETVNGWVHVLKQLRPPEALIPATLQAAIPDFNAVVPSVKDTSEILGQSDVA